MVAKPVLMIVVENGKNERNKRGGADKIGESCRPVKIIQGTWAILITIIVFPFIFTSYGKTENFERK